MSHPDDFLSRLFAAMVSGIEAHSELLSVVLPRMAPESVVVAAAAHGLVKALPRDGWEVWLEAPGDKPKSRSDLTVRGKLAPIVVDIEYKLLWSKGLSECIGGIRTGRKRIAGRPNGYVAVFVYEISECPSEHAARITNKLLDDTLQTSIAKLEAEPVFRSHPLTIAGHGATAQACLVIWGGRSVVSVKPSE